MSQKRRQGDPPTPRILLDREVFAAYLEFKAEGHPAPTDKLNIGSFYQWMRESRPAIHGRATRKVTGLDDVIEYYCVVVGVPLA